MIVAGRTDGEIADALEVSREDVNRLKNQHPVFIA